MLESLTQKGGFLASIEKVEVVLERPSTLPEVTTCSECHAKDSAVFTLAVLEEFRYKGREIHFIFPAWVCRSPNCEKYIFFQPLGTQVVSRIVGSLVQMGFTEEEMDGFLNLSWLPKTV